MTPLTTIDLSKNGLGPATGPTPRRTKPSPFFEFEDPEAPQEPETITLQRQPSDALNIFHETFNPSSRSFALDREVSEKVAMAAEAEKVPLTGEVDDARSTPDLIETSM